jgi:esterase/lipase
MKRLGATLALLILAGCSSTQPNATQAPRSSSTTTTTSAPPKAPVTPVAHTYKPAPPVSYKPSVPERTVKTSKGYLVNSCVPKQLYNNVVTLTTSDKVHLSALVLGSGPNGIVLSHEQGYYICSFLEIAQRLAAQGFQVILPEYRNHNASEASKDNDHLDRDATAALNELRRRGVKRTFFGGASCGGTISAVMASRQPDLVGLLIMSSPAQCGSLDGVAAIRKIKAPTLMIVSPGDMNGAVEREVRKLYAASGSSSKRLVINNSGYHGTDMFREADDRKQVLATVSDFVVACYA